MHVPTLCSPCFFQNEAGPRGLGSRDEKKTGRFVEGEQLYAAPPLFFSFFRFEGSFSCCNCVTDSQKEWEAHVWHTAPLGFSKILVLLWDSEGCIRVEQHPYISVFMGVGVVGGLPTCLTAASSTSSVSLGQGHAHTWQATPTIPSHTHKPDLLSPGPGPPLWFLLHANSWNPGDWTPKPWE